MAFLKRLCALGILPRPAIVLQEAGGQVRPLDGAPFRFDRSSGMVGGNPVAFPALWDGIQEEYQEWKREKKLIK